MESRTASPSSTGLAAASPDLSVEAALHDVSNALTVMLGWLDAAADEHADAATKARAIAMATAGARQAQTLARRAIGGATAGDVPSSGEQVARSVIDALSLEAERRQVDLRVSGIASGNVAEPSAVAHVLTNLLLNALAYAPSSSVVSLTIAQDAGVARFIVADQGAGIPPSQVARLFDGVSTRPGGAGIGLAHARREARRLGGDLGLLSSAAGAAFELSLPVTAHERPSQPPPSAPGRARLDGLVVVALEDDTAVCALLDAGLGARGADIVAVHDAEHLSRALGDCSRVDAILLDLSPIAHDVEGTLAEIRARHPNAGLIFISGSAIAVPAAVAADAPHVRWVRKPFEVAEVAQAIADIVALR